MADEVVWWATGAVWLFAAGASRAEVVLRPDASCSTVVKVMDSADLQQIRSVVQLINDALVEADRPFVQARRGSIMQPLSKDGLTGVVAKGNWPVPDSPSAIA